MAKIKEEELNRVYNSLHKPKERVLPANEKKPRRVDSLSDIRTAKQIIYMIDGYNLLYADEQLAGIAAKDLISARDKVIDLVCDFQGYAGRPCFLIFDAYRNEMPAVTISRNDNITIIYTKAGQTADMFIEAKAAEYGEQYKIFVVTSDNLEQLKILSANCLRMSSKEFLHRYENLQKKYAPKNDSFHHKPLKELRKMLYEE